MAPSIPAGCFSGPPLPKEKVGTQKQTPPSKSSTPQESGSFAVNLDRISGQDGNAAKTPKTKSAWQGKKERRKKQKRKRERPPWRK
ncbi:MAG: hypothetical protein KJP06_00320, partial [Deltaproteobacteria bacterium]|nr:hypothetical protein [Deltaproteobacteria bacterium]